MIDLNDLSAFPEPVRRFASYKLTVQNCSVRTVTEYLCDLRTFCRYMTAVRGGRPLEGESFTEADISGLDMKFFDSIKSDDIYGFINYAVGTRENGSAARSRKLSALRSFYKYLTVKMHLIDNDPTVGIDSPKKKKQLPKHLSVDECTELLTSVLNDTSSNTRERDYCILTLFLNCGMRLSELCGISLGDIDRTMTSMRVLGKGAKERVIYLNSAARASLEMYMPVRLAAANVKPGETALFISRLGKRISVKTVQWMVKKYLGEAGLEYKHYSTHKLRHTAATLMYQSGDVDIRVLKDILGHEQLNTTQIYTHVSDVGMEKAMEHNPLAHLKLRPCAGGGAHTASGSAHGAGGADVTADADSTDTSSAPGGTPASSGKDGENG